MRLIATLCGLAAAMILAGGASASPRPDDGQLARWADATVSADIAQHRASGAAVAIVHDGRIVFMKGYGRADALKGGAVDPAATLFSLGSITKLFTATAIEQLLERGRIRSLDDPANLYLKRIQLPHPFGRQITVRDLLDHRGGFDESIYGLATPTAVAAPVPGRAIAARLPPPVRPPGQVSVYSNAGYGVLGALIEDVSGMSYGDYVARNILRPLGMDRAYIRYDPAGPIATPGEVGPDGRLSPIPQNWAYHPFIAPSASLVATPQDMARFMMGQLEAEHGLEPQLVSAAGAHRLHDRRTANAPATTGFGMSFFAHSWNGQRVAENAGSGPGFQATLILLPDSDLGFITLIMGDSSTPGRSLDMFEVREQFLNEYLGPLQPRLGPPSGLPPARFAGLYRNERRPHLTSEALLEPGTTLKVEAGPDRTLTINGRAGYHEIASGVFWKPGVIPFVPDEASSDLFAFQIGPRGKVTGVVPYLGMDIYRPALLAPGTVLDLIAGVLLVCASGLAGLFWPAATGAERWAKGLAAALGGLALAGPAGLFAGLKAQGNPMLALGFGRVGVYVAAAVVANLFLVLAAALLAATLACWIGGGGGGGARRLRNLHFSALAIVGLSAAPLLAYFNLVGFHVP